LSGVIAASAVVSTADAIFFFLNKLLNFGPIMRLPKLS